MPPTITGSSVADKRPNPNERESERRSELICRVKYGNTLPDIPFDLKFLQYPFDSHRFVKYNPTSLERSYKYDILTEHDLGVTIDLINREIYLPDPNATLDPADEKLLEDDVNTPQDSVRSRQHSRSVSWLRKSEYISTEQTRFQPQNLENIEAKVGYNVKKSLREETLYLDREAQVKAIEKTFADAKQEITKHYSKQNVFPVEVFPVYPDFENWKYPCAQVIFDSDPAPVGKNVPAQIEEMSQAMIRGVMDESGEQFVAYFLPTESTLEKRRIDLSNNLLYKEGEEYEYKIAREYNWNVKSKASKGYEENYFFVIKSDGVYYNELETRVRLNKRRVKAGQQANNTKLIIKHRPLDANEHRMQRYREKQLEPPGEEDEEEEVEAEQAEQNSEEKDDDTEINQIVRDREMRSRTNSRSSPGSPATSRSRSRSHSRSHSKSTSRSRSRSGTRSPSKSRSRSRSTSSSASEHSNSTRSHSGSRSRSQSRSSSKTRKSRSRSRSGSANKLKKVRSGSVTNSERSSHSRSRSNSRSRSRSQTATGSKRPSRSRSTSHSDTNSEATSVNEKSNSGSGSDGSDEEK